MRQPFLEKSFFFTMKKTASRNFEKVQNISKTKNKNDDGSEYLENQKQIIFLTSEYHVHENMIQNQNLHLFFRDFQAFLT